MKIDFLTRKPNLGTLLLGAFALLLLSANCVEAKPLKICFGPTRPAIQKDGRHTGSADYDSLFDADAPWQRTKRASSKHMLPLKVGHRAVPKMPGTCARG